MKFYKTKKILWGVSRKQMGWIKQPRRLWQLGVFKLWFSGFIIVGVMNPIIINDDIKYGYPSRPQTGVDNYEEIKLVPKMEVEQKTKTYDINRITRAIYQIESSGGKNDPCNRLGLFNGYGYAPGTCYKSHEEITNLVEEWFRGKLLGVNLASAVCTYNLGGGSIHFSDCVNQTDSGKYLTKFLKEYNK